MSGSEREIRVAGRSVAFGAARSSAAISDTQTSELRYDEAHWRLEGRRWTGEDAARSSRSATGSRRAASGTSTAGAGSARSTRRAGTLPVAIEVAAWFGTPPPPDSEESAAEGAMGETGLEGAAFAPSDGPSGSGDFPPDSSLDEPRPLPLREPDLLRHDRSRRAGVGLEGVAMRHGRHAIAILSVLLVVTIGA